MRFELMTYDLEGHYSIQLNYRYIIARLSPHGTLVSEALAGLRTERECKSQRGEPRTHKLVERPWSCP